MKQAFQWREMSNNSHSSTQHQQLMVLDNNLREEDRDFLTENRFILTVLSLVSLMFVQPLTFKGAAKQSKWWPALTHFTPSHILYLKQKIPDYFETSRFTVARGVYMPAF